MSCSTFTPNSHCCGCHPLASYKVTLPNQKKNYRLLFFSNLDAYEKYTGFQWFPLNTIICPIKFRKRRIRGSNYVFRDIAREKILRKYFLEISFFLGIIFCCQFLHFNRFLFSCFKFCQKTLMNDHIIALEFLKTNLPLFSSTIYINYY